jgi:hypothetical protein
LIQELHAAVNISKYFNIKFGVLFVNENYWKKRTDISLGPFLFLPIDRAQSSSHDDTRGDMLGSGTQRRCKWGPAGLCVSGSWSFSLSFLE